MKIKLHFSRSNWRKLRVSKKIYLDEVKKGNYKIDNDLFEMLEDFMYIIKEKRPTTYCSEGKAKENNERFYVP